MSLEDETELLEVFSPDDGLAVGISISQLTEEDYLYLEYPVVPVRTLIKKSLQFELLECTFGCSTFHPDTLEMSPIEYVRWASVRDGQPSSVRLGYLVQGSWREFVSTSWAPLVIKEFYALLDRLAPFCSVQRISDMEVSIPDVEGMVKGRFSTVGRQHNVEVTVDETHKERIEAMLPSIIERARRELGL